MAKQVLDLEEWELVLSKMHRHHANIQEEVAVIVQTIRKEMKSDLVPLAEEKANYGKVCIKVDTHFFCSKMKCSVYYTHAAKKKHLKVYFLK